MRLGEFRTKTSTNLEALREKVIKKGLIWKKIKEEY